MRHFHVLGLALLVEACLCAQAPTAPAKVPPTEVKGMAPRATPADYQSQTQVGTFTIAAEFSGHSVPTDQGPLSTEDYVVIELGVYGPPGARLKLSSDDFSLRINGKKTPLPSQQYGLVLASVKDPEWEPPKPAKSKTTIGDNSGSQSDPGTPPPPVKIPFEVQRAMSLRVQKAALQEGERLLPRAGLIFFQYHGQDKGIHSVELIYAGPAGKASLEIQP